MDIELLFEMKDKLERDKKGRKFLVLKPEQIAELDPVELGATSNDLFAKADPAWTPPEGWPHGEQRIIEIMAGLLEPGESFAHDVAIVYYHPDPDYRDEAITSLIEHQALAMNELFKKGGYSKFENSLYWEGREQATFDQDRLGVTDDQGYKQKIFKILSEGGSKVAIAGLDPGTPFIADALYLALRPRIREWMERHATKEGLTFKVFDGENRRNIGSLNDEDGAKQRKKLQNKKIDKKLDIADAPIGPKDETIYTIEYRVYELEKLDKIPDDHMDYAYKIRDQLRPLYREIVNKYAVGYNYQEIAELLNIDYPNLRKHAERMRIEVKEIKSRSED